MQYNFREEQAKNIRNTWILIVLFLLVNCGLGFSIGMAIGAGTVYAQTPDGQAVVDPWSPIPGLIGLGVGISIGVIMCVWAWFGGGEMVLRSARARRITEDDKRESLKIQQLFNVTDEVSIAAGLPMPKLYLIETPALNAFATGRNPQTSTVAVTRGLLEVLDRDELQGVVAHEMGHVRNRDILFSVMVSVLVGVTLMLSDAFLRSLWFGGGHRSSSRSRDQSGAAIVWMVIALVFAILAPILAMLMQYAISRKREYLADATAIEFTRNPLGLAGALEKIAGCNTPLDSANRATAHMYIHMPIKKWEQRAQGAMSTHPPIGERIKILKGMAGELAPQ